MQNFDQLFNDIKDAPATVPVVPAGDYLAVVQGTTLEDVELKSGEMRKVLRIFLTLQGNQGIMLSDGSAPVDGTVLDYSIFLPDEADKAVPSKFGKGTMYDVSVRKLKKTFLATGVDPAQYPSLEEALDAMVGAQVIVRVQNKTTEDGTPYEVVQSIRGSQ